MPARPLAGVTQVETSTFGLNPVRTSGESCMKVYFARMSQAFSAVVRDGQLETNRSPIIT